MPQPSTTKDALNAILASSTRVTRRIEIYEADGETLWLDPEIPRLVDGSVSVDMGRDERRSFECTLENSDGALRHDPSGFWYDKVIKVYRGVIYDAPAQPRVLITEDPSSRMQSFFRSVLGLKNVDINLGASTITDFIGYDIIAADSNTGAITKTALYLQAYSLGYSIFTTGLANDEATLPFVASSISKAGGTWGISPSPGDSPLAGGWTAHTFTGLTTAGRLPVSVNATTSIVGIFSYSSTTTFVALVDRNINGARWFHYQPSSWDNATTITIFTKAISYLFNYTPTIAYEVQIGKFYIDRINDKWMPNQIKVTGRDGVKKMLNSKFEHSTTFAAGTDIAELVAAVAANSGIYDTLINTQNQSLTKDVSFDRATERWKAILDICTAANLEVFMNAAGALVVRPFLDPLTSPISLSISAGELGNLVDYEKSSNDSRIRNHVIVSGESSDAISGVAGDLFFAEAINTEPSSPTTVERLGDRSYFYTSPFFTSDGQCQAYADSLLKLMALEEYELSFSSLVFPWLEAGEIVQFLDPRLGVDVPDRYLLSSFTIPLGLGPMSGSGKRVTIVGSGSTPGG